MTRTCASCATEVTRDSQRFCSSCGSELPAAGTEATAPVQLAAPVEPAPAPAPAPVATAWLPTRSGRRISGRTLGFAAVVVLVLGALAYGGFRLLADRGGAGSPDEAVTKLISSAASQDGVGVLKMLDPGEVSGVDDLYASARGRLADAKVADKGTGSLTDAIRIDVSGVETRVDEMGDDAARVYITGGTVKVTLDTAKLPDRLSALASDLPKHKTWTVDADELNDVLASNLGEDQAYLTTVRHDGRWYVSPLATAGEHLIDLYDLQSADYDNIAVAAKEDPTVSKDPEGVVSDVVDAIDSNDPDELLKVLPQDEAGVLAAYTDVAADLIKQYGVHVDARTKGSIDADFEQDGDTGRLTIRKLAVDASAATDDDSASTAVRVDDNCVTAGSDESSSGDSACLGRRAKALADVSSWYVVLRREGDGWQLDPLATAVSYAKDAVAKMPEDVALAGVGLESLIKPTAELTPGKQQTLQTDDNGLLMASIGLKKGQVLVASPDNDNISTHTYAPGSAVDDYAYDVAVAPVGGTYKVFFQHDELKKTSLTPTVRVLDPRPAAAKDALRPFDGSDIGAYTVTISDEDVNSSGPGYSVFDSDGEQLYDETLDPGTYTVIVSEPVVLAPNHPTFADGSTSYSGTVKPEEPADIVVRMSAGQSVDITADGYGEDIALKLGETVADNDVDGTETLSYYAESTGTYTVYLSTYASYPVDFTVTLTDESGY